MTTYSSFGLLSKGKSIVREEKSTKRGTRYLAKGRSSHTNQNKLRRLKSFYEQVFKRSQELKQSKKYPNRKKYFCDRFPTEESYLSKYPLKKVLAKK